MHVKGLIGRPSRITLDPEDDIVIFPKGMVLTSHCGLLVVKAQEGSTLIVRPYRWYDRVFVFVSRLWRTVRFR